MKYLKQKYNIFLFLALLILIIGLILLFPIERNESNLVDAEYWKGVLTISKAYNFENSSLTGSEDYYGKTIYGINSASLKVKIGTTKKYNLEIEATATSPSITKDKNEYQKGSTEQINIAYSVNSPYYSGHVAVDAYDDGEYVDGVSVYENDKTLQFKDATEYEVDLVISPKPVNARAKFYHIDGFWDESIGVDPYYWVLAWQTGLPGETNINEGNKPLERYYGTTVSTGKADGYWNLLEATGKYHLDSPDGPLVDKVRVYSFDTDMIFYADYKYTYFTVTFDKQGGSGGSDSVKTDGVWLMPSISPPSRAGYKFLGYYDSKDASARQRYNSAGKALGRWSWGQNRTVYAHWEALDYYVAFDENGGSGTMAAQTIQYSIPTKLTANLFTKTGYSFAGWNEKANGKGIGYTDEQSVTDLASVGSTITLYAQWTAESYTFSFDKKLSDATVSLTSASYTYGNTYNSSSSPKFPSWSQTGYTFNGWKLGYDNVIYNDSFEVQADYSDATDAQRTFTAQYTANTYKIRFNGNGATSGSMSDLSMTYGSAKNLSANAFVRTGYTFAGWNTEANGSGTSYTNSQSVTNLSSTNGAVVNLYAKWTPITYTIAFNANGGSGSMSSVTKTYDKSYTLPSNTFTRKNYLFKGWSTTSTGVAAYTNTQSLTTDLTSTKDATVTLYAKWEETWANQYTVPTGSGTSAAPYLISSAKELAWLSQQTESGKSISGYYKQTANINLSGYEWLPIGNSSKSFTGIYDGNGYAITNINVKTISGVDRSNLGLFGYTTGATLKNIIILSGTVGVVAGSSWYSGGIVANATNTKIDNCINRATISGGNDHFGGIVGRISGGSITGCQNYGNIVGNLWIGGITGSQIGTTTIKNCYVQCNVTAKSNWSNYGGCNGGIVGVAEGTITVESCTFEGNLYHDQSGSQTNQGGVIGKVNSSATIKNCYVKATMTTVNNHGLATGSATITDCIMEINGKKYCKGSTFSNWVINSNNMPIPSGLTWLATGGTKVSSYTQITALGYTKV